jgi:hypothetical protein
MSREKDPDEGQDLASRARFRQSQCSTALKLGTGEQINGSIIEAEFGYPSENLVSLLYRAMAGQLRDR